MIILRSDVIVAAAEDQRGKRMEEKTKKAMAEAVIAAGQRMLESNLTVETWGNISVRTEEGIICITPSGMAYQEITPSDLVFLDLEGSVCDGSRIPSIETQMHVRIYQSRPDVYAILHTHPVASTVFGVLRKPIPVITDEIAQAIGGEISVADYALPGTDLLAENTVKALGEKNACLLANHGAVCVGKDLNACFKAAIVLETGAEIYQKALAVSGCEPVELKEDDVKAMYDFAQNHYGQRERR